MLRNHIASNMTEITSKENNVSQEIHGLSSEEHAKVI